MSDHIVKHEQLKEVAVDLWTKAKKRDIEALTYDPNTKTLKGTNSSNADLSVSTTLTDLVSINDRAKFTKDVSVNDAGNTNNLYIGEINGNTSNNRILGYRGLTNKVFVDGYVEKLVVYMSSDLAAGTQVPTKTWVIKKGATRADDRVVKALHTGNGTSLQVETFMDNGTERKCVQINVREEFSSEVYFMVKCPNHALQVCHNIKTQYRDDTINMSEEPSGTADSTINFATNNPSNTAIMHIVGRESITSLAEKLRKTQADSSKYVLQSETTATGGAGSANMVARLDGQGKLDKEMLPAIAINDYFRANDFTHAELSKLTFQNGDVVVVTKDTKTKRYLCVDKDNNTSNLTNAFVELNSKDGIITSVNGQTPGTDGNVTVTAENINMSSTDTTKVKAELDKKISNITLKTGDKKKLTVTKADNTTSDVDLTSAFAADNISYSGTIGGAAKTNVKEAIDALNEEAKKGIKTIKNGRPGTDGNIDVTVAQGGATGITMTFGDGGTAVEIATYMTTAEVNEIKSLFT